MKYNVIKEIKIVHVGNMLEKGERLVVIVARNYLSFCQLISN